MVNLNPRRIDRDNNNTPVLYDREIDEYAHAVLADYKPELLRKPGAIDYQHFLESYLDTRIDFQDIYSDDPDRPILAMTVFRPGKVKVFDRESECVRKIPMSAKTVIFNNLIGEPGMESLALFSGLHEAGHITMHWPVYTGETLDGSEYDPDFNSKSIEAFVCCHRGDIQSRNSPKKIRTAEEWREHQADYFAAAVAMPNATFIPFVHGLLREHNYYKGSVTMGRNVDLDILAGDIIPRAIADVYKVSKTAADIKLRKMGFVRNF